MERPNKRPRTDASSEQVDVDEARRENDLRLKSRFEDIFEKYGRDFGPVGDEIDLRTGEIVINNGHLQEMENEQDVSRGLFDEFHPEDDVEQEVDANPGPNGIASSSEPQTGVENAVTEGALYEGFANGQDNYALSGTPYGKPIFTGSYDQGVGTDALYHLSMNSPSFEGPSRRTSTHMTDTAASTRPQSSPSAQGSAPGYRRVSLEPLRNPSEMNEANSGSGSASKLTTPAPKRSSAYRSPSPPGSGSVWAVPGLARRQARKSKHQQQSNPESSCRAQSISRDSPDSDDPLNDGSKMTPSKISPKSQGPQDKDLPIAFNTTNTTLIEQTPQDDIGSNRTDSGQIHEVMLPHAPGDTQEALGEPKSNDAMNDQDPSPVITPSQQQRFADTVEQTARNDTTNRVASIDISPGPLPDYTPQKTIDDPDMVPATTPVKEILSRNERTPSTLLEAPSTDVSESLSPRDVKNIVDQRTIQRIPWQKIFESPGTPRPTQRQLKQLYQARQSRRAALSERSQSWNPQERGKIESFQPTSESTWEEMHSLLPSKSIEEIQTEWIRTCYAQGTAARLQNTRCPNNAETTRGPDPPLTPTGRPYQSSHTPSFSTYGTGLDRMDLTGNGEPTPQSSARSSESPDPLSAALEESQAGTGLSTLEVDTPPNTARKKISRRSLKDPVSPLAKRSASKS